MENTTSIEKILYTILLIYLIPISILNSFINTTEFIISIMADPSGDAPPLPEKKLLRIEYFDDQKENIIYEDKKDCLNKIKELLETNPQNIISISFDYQIGPDLTSRMNFIRCDKHNEWCDQLRDHMVKDFKIWHLMGLEGERPRPKCGQSLGDFLMGQFVIITLKER